MASEGTFHFYHADLGPTNILVSKHGEVTGVLDWESAGFYPEYWICLKPYISAGFFLDLSGESRFEWVHIFGHKLSELGFEFSEEHAQWFKQLDRKFFEVNEVIVQDGVAGGPE